MPQKPVDGSPTPSPAMDPRDVNPEPPQQDTTIAQTPIQATDQSNKLNDNSPQVTQPDTEPVIIHPQPQSPPQESNNPPTPPPPSAFYPKTTRKLFFTIVVLFFFTSAAILGGAIAMAYNNYKLISPPESVRETIDNLIAISPLPKPTRLIVDSTFAKTSALKSADVKTELLMTTNSTSSLISSFKLTMSGPAEFDNPSSKKSEFDIGFDISMEGASFNGNASVKTLEDRVYFKVNEIPFGQIYQQLLDYRGKWYYWDLPEEFKKQEDQATTEKVNKLISDFVKKSEEWSTLVSKDDDLYEFEIKPPKEELVGLVYDIFQVYEPKEHDKITSDLEKEEISKAFEKINDLKITMKVDKDKYFIKSLTAQFNIAIDDTSFPGGPVSTLPQNQTVLNFNITTELSNYNKDVIIVPPEGAINIETAMKDIESKFGQSLQPPVQLNPQATPLPEPFPEEMLPEATEEGSLEEDDLHSLISPEEIILGEKYDWERELIKLFSQII